MKKALAVLRQFETDYVFSDIYLEIWSEFRIDDKEPKTFTRPLSLARDNVVRP